MTPGEIITQDGTITLNAGRETREVEVANVGDRPIQVGTHFHFFGVNRATLRPRRCRARGTSPTCAVDKAGSRGAEHTWSQ